MRLNLYDIGNSSNFVHSVGNDDETDPSCGKPAHDVEEALALSIGEVRRRFVEKNELRPRSKRSSNLYELPLILAVVIGERAHRVAESRALDHVAGYCICNDVSERSFQIERGGTWTKGKGCPTFGPLGPWLVTGDEIDIDRLSMTLSVNGDLMQHGSTETMIFRVPFLVSYISQFMDLLPGDVITTGTPPGVGMGFKPPRYLQPCDRMDLAIDGLGTQSQKLVASLAPVS